MTVIAWDGKTLAADRRVSSSGTLIRTSTKIFRIGSDRVGVFGNLDVANEMLEWFRRGGDPAQFPAKQREKNCAGLLVIRDGAALEYGESPYPLLIESVHHAVGSGRDHALMAMHLGKTAAEAVELVFEFDSGCGNGVDALGLED